MTQETIALPEEYQIDVTVIALVPDYHQAIVRASNGTQFAVTQRTPGVHLETLREGQQLRCLVTRRLPRILRADYL